METKDIELARPAVAVLRDVLAGEGLPRFVSIELDNSAHSLAVYLLARCTHPDDLSNELDQIDAGLADRLANTLLDAVDFDRFDWTG
jgi:hypothetical protein